MNMLFLYYAQLLSSCQLIHSISECLLSSYYVLATIPGSWDDRSVNHTNTPSVVGLRLTNGKYSKPVNCMVC